MLMFMSKIFKWWESFFLGIARTIDLGGTLHRKYSRPKQKSLQETWNEDWNKIGKDFNQALKKYHEKHK